MIAKPRDCPQNQLNKSLNQPLFKYAGNITCTQKHSTSSYCTSLSSYSFPKLARSKFKLPEKLQTQINAPCSRQSKELQIGVHGQNKLEDAEFSREHSEQTMAGTIVRTSQSRSNFTNATTNLEGSAADQWKLATSLWNKLAHFQSRRTANKSEIALQKR